MILKQKEFKILLPQCPQMDPGIYREVSYITITGSSTYNVLIWINPTDKDFEKIVIVRKTDSTPLNKDDGEVVYEGYEPNFCDLTGTPGAHYYYKVFTVDYNGNYSSGSGVDRVIQ